MEEDSPSTNTKKKKPAVVSEEKPQNVDKVFNNPSTEIVRRSGSDGGSSDADGTAGEELSAARAREISNKLLLEKDTELKELNAKMEKMMEIEIVGSGASLSGSTDVFAKGKMNQGK